MSDQPKRLPYHRIAARVFDTPLLIQHSKLLSILRVLGPRLGFDELNGQKLKAMEDESYGPPDPFAHMEHLQGLGIELEPASEGHFVGSGIALIPVHGTLVQRSDWMTDMSGMLSYGRIERMADAAENDARVKEVLYDFDTPGGEVAGAFDFADRIYDMRTHGAKPMTAIINELAASAGYLSASAVGNIVINRTGGAGSIGVVAAHFDYSKAMDKRGIVVTLLYSGEKKVDGNPYEPLSPRAKQDWQDEIDDAYGLFVQSVSRYTGMSTEKVRGTKAGMFVGSKAIDAGLAHRMNTFSNEAANALLRVKQASTPRSMSQQQPETSMTKDQLEEKQKKDAKAKAAREWLTANVEGGEKSIAGKSDDEVISLHAAGLKKIEDDKAAQAKAEAELKDKQGKLAATSGDVGAAVKAERERGNAIRALPEAKGREKLAQMCVDKGMSVDDAKELLAASPKANALSEAMERHGGAGMRSEEAHQDDTYRYSSHSERMAFYNGQMKGEKAPAGR